MKDALFLCIKINLKNRHHLKTNDTINSLSNRFLPTSLKEIKLRGWDEIDVILFTGDAYIDHPSFGAAVIGRVLENEGLKVAIVPQPNWQDDLRDFKKLGKPRLFFGVTAGSMDSMINHYTAGLRLRSDDAYTVGNKAGARPDYAVTVYSNILKSLFPEVPVIIGGIEASLRRLTHYDYWSDSLKPSILIDSKADLLVYGMGEKPIIEISKQLIEGKRINEITDIPQTAFVQPKTFAENKIDEWIDIEIFSHDDCLSSKEKFAKNFKVIEEESNKQNARRIIQPFNKKNAVVVNPPYKLMTESELDSVYDLPFTRLPHPRYNEKEPIPAYEMIRHSINIHRGCFGGCSFCTISAHQGKFVASRSEKSILKEVDAVTKMPDFKGYITDLGGPSANMYKMQGNDLTICAKCKSPSCIFPIICKNLNTNHQALTDLYRKARQHPMIKKITIGSGVRYDILLDERKQDKSHLEYINELILHHVSGRLKVAPEHTSDEVLEVMRKPSFQYFKKFNELFNQINRKHNLNQQLIPYFISSHPACQSRHMAELAIETKRLHFKLEQVQDLTPTPLTLSSVVYYSGIHPYTLKPFKVARTKEQKQKQKMFFFWYKKEHQNELKATLAKTGNSDLIKKLFA